MTVRKKVWLSLLGILILAVLAGIVDYPKGPDIRIGSYFKELKVHLGLDLKGGTHLVYNADTTQLAEKDKAAALDGVRDVIERRVNAFGVSEPVVQTDKSGTQWRVIVELPGVTDVNEAIKLIGETPLLEFKEQADVPTDTNTNTNENTNEAIPLAFKTTTLTGKQLKNASVQFDQKTGAPEISLEFNAEGKKLFADITTRNVNKIVGIFLDGSPISLPRVNEPITEGKAVITGDFTLKEAKTLAQRLNSGALPVPISLVSQQNIGPTLGRVSIEKSLFAGLLGLLLVAIFMIVYYRLPGLLSVVALIIYSLIVLAIFKLWPVTLTLAGIAGYILSIGMAVDANILIFERMKEEIRAGNQLNTAIDEGFKRAWPSIRDSNVSSIITCIILAWFGTSLIKGFAITLAIGILVSMFSAITITRNFLRIIYSSWLEKHLPLMGRVSQKKINEPEEIKNV